MTYDNAKRYALQFVETLFENWNIPNNPEDFIKFDDSNKIIMIEFPHKDVLFSIGINSEYNKMMLMIGDPNRTSSSLVLENTIRWRTWYKILQYMFLHEFMKDCVDPEKNRLKKPE